MAKTDTIQVESRDTVEAALQGEQAAVTLIAMPHNQVINIWLENADGDCAHEFTQEQFETLVTEARKLMGWPTPAHIPAIEV
jgi:hypothetical protein